jgi:hypothetical protein
VNRRMFYNRTKIEPTCPKAGRWTSGAKIRAWRVLFQKHSDFRGEEMNTFLWALQIILFIKFVSVAYSHGFPQHNQSMKQSIGNMGDHGTALHRIIALLVLIGSISILIPSVLKTGNSITVYSGIFLSAMMIFSIYFHIRSREKPTIVADIILFAISVLVTYGRWKWYPI